MTEQIIIYTLNYYDPKVYEGNKFPCLTNILVRKKIPYLWLVSNLWLSNPYLAFSLFL